MSPSHSDVSTTNNKITVYTLRKTELKETCSPTLTAALFTIARTCKQPKCSINREMDKEDVVHIYNGISLNHKKEQNNAICSNTDGPRDCHTE